MAIIDSLLDQVSDGTLRNRLKDEFKKAQNGRKFGLVFEDHLPESTPLYDVPVKKGMKAVVRNSKNDDIYIVKRLDDDTAVCENTVTGETRMFQKDDLVTVAEFGDPIYPYLEKLDNVCNAPDSDLWHTLIEADNYHALQLLEYLYAGKVDCIYIDPPYNTGAKDWKYNNNYVDGTDVYRHSKWLSFMEKRLKLAKKLLNPKESVLIVTIDEKEYLHLGMLLEQMFPEAKMQMVSSVINVKGVARDKEFFRANEYIYFVRFGSCSVNSLDLSDEWLGNVKKSGRDKLRLGSMLRSGSNSHRNHSPGCFYPILFKQDGTYVGTGEPIAIGVDRHSIAFPDGIVAVWPIHKDGSEGVWQYGRDGFCDLVNRGLVFFGKLNGDKIGISYAPKGVQKKITDGLFKISGMNADGSVIIDDSNYGGSFIPNNQWSITSHNATEYGTKLNLSLMPDRKFPYPKSLYAVEDVLRFFVANKPNALIVDFFAGSGTTLHATMLLNHLDGGHRRCILVTNNEVSNDEAKTLTKQGLQPGNPDWEKHGIARYVTWPRTKAAITGINTLGEPIKGNYKFTEEFPMSDGFKANAVFFKLGFLDKYSVVLGQQFNELLPVLWMKAGCHGECPKNDGKKIPGKLVLPENQMAILTKESLFKLFCDEVKKDDRLKTIYIVTDSADGYKSMISHFKDRDTYQLYRDYLDNFRINTINTRRC